MLGDAPCPAQAELPPLGKLRAHSLGVARNRRQPKVVQSGRCRAARDAPRVASAQHGTAMPRLIFISAPLLLAACNTITLHRETLDLEPVLFEPQTTACARAIQERDGGHGVAVLLQKIEPMDGPPVRVMMRSKSTNRIWYCESEPDGTINDLVPASSCRLRPALGRGETASLGKSGVA